MKSLSKLTIALLLALPAASIAAQAPAPVTTITRVTLYRVLPGQGPAMAKDFKEHFIPLEEEYKKAGLIVAYGMFTNSTKKDENDWTVGTTVTYANWGALDGLGAKTSPITLKHYGTAEMRTAAGDARNAIRVVVSASWLGAYNP